MRQFICDSLPDSSGRITVTGRNYRYLVKVLRYSEGDVFDARLPEGGLVQLSVEKIMPSSALLRCVSEPEDPASGIQGVHAADVQQVRENGPEIWLFQFLPKPQKMDLIIRQATECGVRKIIPVIGEFSVRNDASGRVDRWDRIVREARQQCGSAVPTEVIPAVSPQAAVELWQEKAAAFSGDAEARAFMLDEEPAAGRGSLCMVPGKKIACAALAVGSEGGMSPAEKALFAESGFLPLHFMTNVLRTETAALYGTAVIQQYYSADGIIKG